MPSDAEPGEVLEDDISFFEIWTVYRYSIDFASVDFNFNDALAGGVE